jgi:[ribosomal protein S5]-alanine N-acetyltransferase
MKFEIVTTNRLFLKGLSPSDMEFLFKHGTKEEIKIILGHRSEEDYQKEANKHQNGYASYNSSFKRFLLMDKATNRIIGRCGLHNWNKEHRRAEVGYVMEDEDFKRKGLMTEALAATMDYGFNKMHLNRIEALVGIGNIPSLRLIERYNFVQEGVMRQHHYRSGEYEDSMLFSKLRSEYVKEQHG